MFPQNVLNVTDATLASPTDALTRLKQLTPALLDRRPEDLGDVLPVLSTAIDQLVAEHQGMADELVCVYEQLGITFEVTRNLAGVEEEAQVLKLFASSLSRSFQQRRLGLLVPARSGGWNVLEGMCKVTSRLCEVLQRVQARRGAVVEKIGESGDAEVMISPVFAGDVLAAVIVLESNSGAPPYIASEKLLVESLSTFCGDVIRSRRLVGELRGMSMAMVRSLVSAVDQKDEYTCGHSLRVSYYATALGRVLDLPAADLQMLQWSALLHDVGKIGIRDAVLKKEGKLTPEEFAHIKEHPVRSHKVVQQVPQLAKALDGVLYHHERFDGSGYPSGLRGEDIPLQARIIQIADVFDALTSNRAYRDAFPCEKALQIMAEEAGKTNDPRLREMFDGWVRAQVGSDGSGWKALVARANNAGGEINSGDAPVEGP